MAGQRQLKIALRGLGRLGALRARILAFQQPRIELVAVCDTKPDAQQWAADHLPSSVQFFADPEECMARSFAEAVLISTATATHAALISVALDLNLHVMCEKPISTDIETTGEVVQKAASKPHLKFLLPFSRRYDESYRVAKAMANEGSLGDIHAVNATCFDPQDQNGMVPAHGISFCHDNANKASLLRYLLCPIGEIFVDAGIHLIDVGRYFLDVNCDISNPNQQVRRVTAVGQQAVYPKLADFGDADNACGTVEFSNGKILQMHLSRTITNGFEACTRICGTKSHAIINGNSALNRVELRDVYGVRTATTPDAFALYDKTFVEDVAEFASAVLDDQPLSCTPDDAYEAGKIACALQHSFRTGEPVYFDKTGLPIMTSAKANGANGVH